MATGDWWSSKYGYTGSYSYNPAYRWLRVLGHSSLDQSSSGVRQPPECLSSPLEESLCSPPWRKELEKVPQTYPTSSHPSQHVTAGGDPTQRPNPKGTHPRVSHMWAGLLGLDWPHQSPPDPQSQIFHLTLKSWSSSTPNDEHHIITLRLRGP